MGIALIKKLNEKTPYWVKAPFAKFIRDKLITNKVFIQTYVQLNEADEYSQEQIEKVQLAKLKETLIHAYEHSPYYKRVLNEAEFDPYSVTSISCLQKLPVLTKSDLKQHYDELQADDIEDFYLVTTGGTSGEPTKVNMERDAIYREWAFIYHYWGRFGYDYRKSRIATFRGVDMGNNISQINPLYNEIRLNPFILNHENVGLYQKKIENYGASFIYGYPSAIYNFCRLSQEKNMDLAGQFKAVLLISENLYDFQKELIEAVLECPTVIFYGHSERAVFAEKYADGYSFNPLYGVTEIDPLGQPIVTGFINRKTPLIRYLVDDRVEAVAENRYSIIGHHDSDVLLGEKGEQISMAAINFHDDTFEGVEAYQFVQDELGSCKVRIVSSSTILPNQIDKIKRRVESKLGGGFRCEVEITDKIAYTARGKYQMLIQNIDRS